MRRPWGKGPGSSIDALASRLRQTPVEAFGDQNLSKLGDSLLNLIYSLNLSLCQGAASGGKIPNRILAKAIEHSTHKSLIPRRSDRHRKGDIVEAIFAYAWLKGKLDIRRSAEFIASRLDPASLPMDPDQYARALGELMDKVLDEVGVVGEA